MIRFLIYAGLGPPVGLLAFLFLASLKAAIASPYGHDGSPAWHGLITPGLWPGFLLAAFLIGIVPAVSACAGGALSSDRSLSKRVLTAAAFGSSAIVGECLILYMRELAERRYGIPRSFDFAVLAILILVGAVSASVCETFVAGVSALQSGSSRGLLRRVF